MLEDVSRTPNRLKMTHNKNICILLKCLRFGDTILRGGVTSFRTQPMYYTFSVSNDMIMKT